jgi:outer membrane protein assembly factor BamD (BamD/ComL family)
VVEDPLPSGVEVMEREVSGPHSRFERRDEKAVFFLDALHGIATLTYVCRAVLPGDFHALPAVAAAMYQPEVRGRSAEARVRFTAEPAEETPPTPDELYLGGIAAARKQRWKDALARFEALLARYKLQDQFHDEVLLHQVRGSLVTDRGRAAIAAWEELRGRNPAKAELTADEKWLLARVYHEQREAERALELYDDLVLRAFERDRAVAQAYLDLGQPQPAQDFLKTLLVAYPDFNPVVSEWYQRGMRFTGMRRPARARSPWLDVEEELMKSEAYGELKAFGAYYPDHPLADDALYQAIRCLADLKLPVRAAEEAARFERRHPKSPWLDETLAIRMESEYVRDRFDAARAAGTALEQGRFPESDARDAPLKPSPYAEQATLVLAKIAHLQGDLARAVELYRKVAAKYPDARDSLAFLTAKRIEVKPLHVFGAAARDPEVTATVQNVKELAGKVYAVDLAVLFAARKNLKDVHRIDLTGIAPLSTFTAAPASPAELRAVDVPVRAPVTGPGVFLLVLRGDGVDASTLVLLTDLAVRVQRVEGGVRVHVEEQGKPARGASVRIGDGSRIVAEGQTDSRGIFEARAEAGAVAVVAEKGGQTAFHQE